VNRETRRQGDRETGGQSDREEVALRILRHNDLDVYKKAFDAAMRIFELSKRFPKEVETKLPICTASTRKF